MIVRLFSLFFIFNYPVLLFGQTPKIDSLQQALQEAQVDSNKVNALLDLAGEYKLEGDAEEAKLYINQAYDLSVTSHFERGIAMSKWLIADLAYAENDIKRALDEYEESRDLLINLGDELLLNKVLYNLGVVQLGVGMYDESIFNLEKVERHQANIADTLSQIVTLGRLANAYERHGNYDKSITLSERGLFLARVKGEPLRSALSLNNLGIVYRKIGKTKLSLDCYYRALTYAKDGGHLAFQANFLENIGNVHSNRGEYVQALESYMKALRLFEEMGDESNMISVGYNAGLVYKLNKEYDKALNFYFKALNYDIANLDTLGIINAHHNIGSAYLEKGDLLEAKKYLMASYNLLQVSQLNCLDGIGALMGKLYYQKRQYDSAKYFLSMELQSIDSCKTDAKYPETAYLMGLVYREYGKRSLALSFFTKSLYAAQKSDYLRVVGDAAFALYQEYKKMGNAPKALEFHEIFQQTTDSLFNQENTRNMAWLEANYEMEKVADSLQLEKENEAEIFELKIAEEQKKQAIIFIASLAVLLILISTYLYLRKRRALIYQLSLTKEKEAGFKALITGIEDERKRIARDLHDGVVQQMAVIKFALTNVASRLSGDEANDIAKAKEMVEAAAAETRDLSHQMMPKALSELGLLPAMEEVIENNFGTHDIKVDFQHFGLRDRYENSIEIVIYRIFQELVHNIIKHSGASSVDVQLMENAGKLLLVVEDNGVGMIEAKRTGIGISNIESRLTIIDGKVNYTSGDLSGTVATIVIPI
ncbi:MAG: tetratricopeptide repeat protein [Cyclobacteriaceae bacterium]